MASTNGTGLDLSEDIKHLRTVGYLLGGRVNKGAFSIVHCGLEMKSGNVVAIKIINLNAVSRNFRDRFLPRELSNIKRFNHPSIIKVRKISRNENKIYIIMDFAFSSLKKEINDRSYIGEKQAKKWFFQLTSAFEYLQSHGVAHRDIKLENILIDKQRHVKICDFGFSKLVAPPRKQQATEASIEHSRTFCGSIAYCAPEILQKTPYDPHKSDVWSLGVVLYKMVVGQMPFGEGNDLACVKKVADAQGKSIEFPPFPKTSLHCQQLIRAMLTVETSKRISLTEVLQSPWLCLAAPSNAPSSVFNFGAGGSPQYCDSKTSAATGSTTFSLVSRRCNITSQRIQGIHNGLRKNPSTCSSRSSRFSLDSKASNMSNVVRRSTPSLMTRLRRNFQLFSPRSILKKKSSTLD